MTKYLMYSKERLNESLNNLDLDEKVRVEISLRMSIIEELIEKCSFQELSKEDKQAVRIGSLASSKKRGKDVSKKKAVLELYDKINVFLPYLKSFNQNHNFNDLNSLLNEELQLIDFGYLNFEKFHISESDLRISIENFEKHLDNNILLENEIKEKTEWLKNAFFLVFSL